MILGLNPFVWKISLLIPLIILFGCEQYIYQDSGSTSRLTAKNDIKFTKSEKNGDDSTYLVQQDDNLYSISRNLKIPLNLLIKANNLHPPYLLRTGQKLQVPRGSFYTVKKGDTLFRIAKNNDISVYELCKINSIKSANKIYFGQKLQLPLPVQRQEQIAQNNKKQLIKNCLLYTSPSPRDGLLSRMPSSA